MATTARVVMDFEGTNGSVTFAYNYFNPSTTSAQVRAIANALITNGSIFENPPTAIKSAKLVSTTEQDYELEI